MRVLLKSKIQCARVTDSNINYEASLTIDRWLMDEADILPGEEVEVLNVNNGARFTTYAIEGERGEVCVNGPAARQAVIGDAVIIFSYCYVRDEDVHGFVPRIVRVDGRNEPVTTRHGARAMTLLEAE